MTISGTAIWFLGVSLLVFFIGGSAVLMERRARLSRVKTDGKQLLGGLVCNSPVLGRWGLLCSTLGLVTALYLAPVARYLPENIGAPVFIYSLLAFPVFVALGLTLSVVGYISNRQRVNLTAMAVGGLALLWLAISFSLRL